MRPPPHTSVIFPRGARSPSLAALLTMVHPETAAEPGTASSAREFLLRRVPALESLRDYSTESFGLDLMAGLTVAAVALPQAMAYAQIAGIPAQYGLYTAIVMTAVGALLDSSKQLINGPTNAISIAVFSAIAAFGDADRLPAAILLALLVGVVQTGITLLRLGDLTRYISHAVIVGFTLGAAVLLVLDQAKNLLGIPAFGSGEDHFLKRFYLTMSHVDMTNRMTVLVGLVAVVIAVAFRLINGRYRTRFPESLLAVTGAAAVVWAFGLDQQGVKVVGSIPAALPTFKLPELSWSRVNDLAGNSVAIALLGLLEAISMAKAIASRSGQKLDIDQQCLSEGVANLFGSFFQCFPGSGSLTRSSINVQAGARTQWSGVICAGAVALTVTLFAPYAYYIPRSGLAGILMISAWRLVDRRQLRYHLRTTRYDALIVIFTAVSAVAISIEFCVLIGVLMSFVLYVPRAARMHMTELTLTSDRVVRERIATDPPCGRIRIFSLEGEMFFGAAPELEQHLETIAAVAREGVRVVVLRVKRARNPDAVCLGVLREFFGAMRDVGVTVLLCGVRPDLMAVLESSGIASQLGTKRVFVFQETGEVWTSTLEAIRVAYELIGDDVCEICPRHGKSLAERRGWHYVI